MRELLLTLEDVGKPIGYYKGRGQLKSSLRTRGFYDPLTSWLWRGGPPAQLPKANDGHRLRPLGCHLPMVPVPHTESLPETGWRGIECTVSFNRHRKPA